MKKLKWLVVVFAGLFVITGCGKKDYSSIIDESRKKMEDLSNYSVKMDMNIGAKTSGIEMNIPMSINMKLDAKSKIAQMDMTVSVFGIKVTTESYLDMSKEQAVTYTKENLSDTWTKEYSENTANLQEFTSITENSSKIEKKKSDEKGVDHYAVTISKEKMQELLSESMNSMGSETEGYEVEEDVVVDLYINQKSGYITKMDMDLADVIKMDEEDGEITAFTMTLTFADFNTVGKVTIPEEVIANALEKSDTDLDSEEFDI